MTSFEARRAAREEMHGVVRALISEFPALPPGTVIRHTARAQETLLRQGVRSGLAQATQTFVRASLRHITPAHSR